MTTIASDYVADIAIIGFAGRFPGAPDIETFWSNLCAGVESVSFFSEQELEAAGVPAEIRSRPDHVRAGAVLDDVDLFDASFFTITGREAETMDPQHRLFLECAWEALEHAGYAADLHPGAVGLYAGVGLSTYLLFNLYPHYGASNTVGSFQMLLGNDKDYLATRVSYKLNLNGPSLTVQTACSTSLVAVHLACQSLLNGECDIALAGGVSIWLPQKAGYVHQTGMVLSPDGHCRAFDAEAQGTVRGNGLGMVVLKPLAAALADGDTVHAVIKGSAINNDGALKIGYTAPSMEHQREVIIQAQAVARVPAETISYIEAHGTATPLGDPVEIDALTQAFRVSTQKRQFCAIGSLKTNIGHLVEASGVAGLIKTVLMLKHRRIPPSLHFRTPNPQIDFASSPFYVNTRLDEWKAGPAPRRAGISSFGIGGTNAHVIVEEAPLAPPSSASRSQQLLVISAKSRAALEKASRNLARYLKRHPDLSLADAAYTLQVGRKLLSHRQMLVCQNLDDAVRVLEQRAPERLSLAHQEATSRPVAFMFPGQGAQYAGMGRELYETEPVFREHVDQCAELLRPQLGLDLRKVLYPDLKIEDRRWKIEDTESSILYPLSSILDLDQTWLTQPALFVVEYALARLWMAWGVQPQAMIGHSIGEYVAACLAGVLSLEDALQLVAIRGRLMQSQPAGAMLTVDLSEAALLPRLNERLALAAVNGANTCVVSGPVEEIQILRNQLASAETGCRLLRTSHAFHSAMMEPIVAPFLEHMQHVRLHPPHIPYLSNVTGQWITGAQATDPAYWAAQLRQTVRFYDGLQVLSQTPERVLLEVGPGHSLSTLARQHPDRAAEQVMIASMRHPNDQLPDAAVLLGALGRLWLAGVPIEWAGFYVHERRRRIPLPTYPFERQRYWIDPPAPVAVAAPAQTTTDAASVSRWLYLPGWKPSNPLAGGQSEHPADLQRCWLLFMDACGLGEQLAQRLEQSGRTVVRVEAGTQFGRLDQGRYTLAPDRAEDYHTLVGELCDQGRRPDVVLHCWGLADAEGLAADGPLQERGFYSLLFLAQALGRQDTTEPCQIWIVTNDMHVVTGHERVCPEKATVLGPCRVIPLEYPTLLCRSIDLSLPDVETNPAQCADHVLAEVAVAAETVDPVIAYRGQRRWVPQVEQVQLESTNGHTRLREGGVYLITGGLGGMGLQLAQNLARNVRAKLILVGRSALPPRDSWEAWLADPERDPRLAERIRAVRELEAAGAEVVVACADVADLEQMRSVVQDARRRFGAIHGVVHAAGVAGGGLIQLKTPELAAHVLAPKLQGTRVIETLFKAEGLDFLVLCSSLLSTLGGVGQVDYSAANAFLDAFAHAQRAQGGCFTVSINWDTWKEVGMAVRAAEEARAGSRPMPPAADRHPLLDGIVEDSDHTRVYLSRLSVAKHWVLAEHRLGGTALLPGTAYLELARAAAEPYAQGRALQMRDVFLLAPLQVQEVEVKDVRTTLRRDGAQMHFSITSRDELGKWQEHARGTLSWDESAAPQQPDLQALLARYPLADQPAGRQNEPTGPLTLGPRWQSLRSVCWQRTEGLAYLELPAAFAADTAEWVVHPALLDVAIGFATGSRPHATYLPFSYKRLRIDAPLPARIYSYVRDTTDPLVANDLLVFDIRIMDEQGRSLIEVEEYTLRRIAQERSLAAASPSNGYHPAEHQPQPDYLNLEAGMTSREGVEVFHRILAHAWPQVIVSTQDWQARMQQAQAHSLLDYLAMSPGPGPRGAAQERPALASPYVPPRNEIEGIIVNIWQEVLGIADLGIHDNFFELGGTSLSGLQVISRLKETLGLDISPIRLFEGPTVSALAGLISQEERSSSYDVDMKRGKTRKEYLQRKRQANERR